MASASRCVPPAGTISPLPEPQVNRVRTYLGLEHNIVIMLVTILLIGMGEELWSRYFPKYIELLGGTAWAVAAYGTLVDFLDAVYQYPGGWLADRLGRKRALVVFALFAIGGYVSYLLGRSWEVLLIGTILVCSWGSLTSPAIFAIIGDNLPSDRRAIGFGVQSILKRIPIVIAPVLGGLLISGLGMYGGMHLGFAITILLAGGAIVILLKKYREREPEQPDTMRMKEIWRGMDPALKRLLVADCLARWAEGIPNVFIVLFTMNVLGASAVQFGWLIAIEMITAIVVYIPIARMADRLNRKPFVVLTFGLFALFPLALGTASGFLWIAAAFVVAGLREIGEPARKALIVDLAHDERRGRTVGIYYNVRGLVVFPASLLGGWLWTIDVRLPFYTAFAAGVVGFLYYLLFVPDEH